MVLAAGALFAVNGTVAKIALESGLSSLRLTETRCVGAFAGLALIRAVSFAADVLLAEHAVGRRDALSLLAYGFLFASLFWAAAQPWWSYPFSNLDRSVSLLGNLAGRHAPLWALVVWMVVLGTIAPFLLIVG